MAQLRSNQAMKSNGVVFNTKSSTICWTCRNATGNCSWSDGSFTPVKGWVAEYAPLGSKGQIESYIVRKCPLYKKG